MFMKKIIAMALIATMLMTGEAVMAAPKTDSASQTKAPKKWDSTLQTPEIIQQQTDKIEAAEGVVTNDSKKLEETIFHIEIQNTKNRYRTFKGNITDNTTWEFEDWYVDGSYQGYMGSDSFSMTLDTAQFGVGIHKIEVEVVDDEDNYDTLEIQFATYIYSKSSNKPSYYTTFSNCLYFKAPYISNYDYSGYGLCIKKNGKWYATNTKNSSQIIGSYETMRIKKLKGNKKYQLRTFYTALKDGYSFNGPLSKTVTVKTGPKKKPPVKKIYTKNAKVHSYTFSIYYPSLGIIRYYRSYYTTFTAVVKMKKKPKCKGIWIGSKKVKGNKKTYKTKFSISGKLKGKKLKFAVQSYGSNVYGAYSPVYKKKVKIKGKKKK